MVKCPMRERAAERPASDVRVWPPVLPVSAAGGVSSPVAKGSGPADSRVPSVELGSSPGMARDYPSDGPRLPHRVALMPSPPRPEGWSARLYARLRDG